MAEERVLITGAAGKVATLLRPRLVRPGRSVRLLDIVEPAPMDSLDGAVAALSRRSCSRR